MEQKDIIRPINSFPGYEYIEAGVLDKKPHNMYRGDDVGFGGWVYSNPGMYYDVGLLDSASHHPTSAICMNYFGEYTQNFKDILDARILIKHRDFDAARKLMGGRLAPYLNDENQADDLAQALKIAVNSVYGLTSASFENPFRDSRNVNNIVALRGALFMRLLQDEVSSQGYTVVSIRTDSIKIANIDDKIIKFVMDFARPYGYTFEHEATYEKMCLVDKTNYVAKYDSHGIRNKGGKHAGEWTVTGDNFAHPYIFKTLFTRKPIVFDDFREVKAVSKGELYLDMNEGLPEGEHEYQFIGKVGAFCPIAPGKGGGELYRFNEGKYYAAAGTKGYRWLEFELVKSVGKERDIDMSYYRKLVDDALAQISEYGDAEAFIADDTPHFNVLPWCDESECQSCADREDCQSLAAAY